MSLMNTNETMKMLRRAANERILLTTARKLEKAHMVFINEGSRYRRTEFGREVGPVFVTVQLREVAQKLLAFTKEQVEVLEMAHEAGTISGNVAAQIRYFDCAEEDASGCFDNRCENIAALAEKVGVTVEARQTAFMFGRAGINKLA